MSNSNENMREIVIKRLKFDGTWDLHWKERDNCAPYTKEGSELYVKFLETLSDKNLLDTFIRVRQITDNLD